LLRRPSAGLLGLVMVGPGVVGGIGIIFGLPGVLLLVLAAGAAGFVVAHPAGGRAPLSAFAGAGAAFVALLTVAAPFVPALVTDAEFRSAAVGLAGLITPLIVVGVGLGALAGYGGAFVGRDVARRRAGN
jgi:hypothetical protein